MSPAGTRPAIARATAIPRAPRAPISEARSDRAIPHPEPKPGPPEALYVHVPFCLSLCPYCDFVVVAGSAARGPRSRVGAFVSALRRELELRAEALDALWGPPGRAPRPALGSLYFGGGTPSLLDSAVLADLIGLVRDRFGLTEDAEITLESNPGPDERGNARALVAAGVTRLSFGAQAFDPSTLQALGRRHRVGDIRDAVTAAREARVASVSLDLLYDTPGGTIARWMEALESAIALEPDHLSLYALTLDDPDEEGLTGATGDHLPVTRGARRWRDRARAGQDDDRAAAMYEYADDRLKSAGFHGYEISNWARPGHESRHNTGYWTRRPHAAAGPGAHAFDGMTRSWNAGRLDAYLEALTPDDGSRGHPPPGGADAINAVTAAAESVILGLRLARGIPLEAAEQPPLAEHLGWAIGNGLLAVTSEDRVVLTSRGKLLSNELFVRLI